MTEIKSNINSGLCLFCKQKVDSTSGIEHIIPESLGNKNLFLKRGIVCQKCNCKLGKLDDNFIHHSYNVVFKLNQNFITKKEKLPSTLFKDIVLMKNPNGTIRVAKSKKHKKEDEVFEIKKNGTAEYLLRFHQDINPLLISRFLAKVGIETLFFQRNEFAFKNRFDNLRNYAIGKGDITFFKFGLKELNTSSFYTQLMILMSCDEIIDKPEQILYFVWLCVPFALYFFPLDKISETIALERICKLHGLKLIDSNKKSTQEYEFWFPKLIKQQ